MRCNYKETTNGKVKTTDTERRKKNQKRRENGRGNRSGGVGDRGAKGSVPLFGNQLRCVISAGRGS